MANDDKSGSELPVTLVNNGTVRLTVGGKLYRLRRPKMGEFRQLREAIQEVNDEIEAKARALQHEATLIDRQVLELLGLPADADGEAVADAERQLPMVAEEITKLRSEARQHGRQFTDEAEAARLGWAHQVLLTLSQDGAPALEDLEPWMATARWWASLLAHWQSVPLGLGGG